MSGEDSPVDKAGKVAIRGQFRVVTADGTEVTPARRKDRGLLALLALAPERRRPRAFLRDMLWSQSTVDRANASLRRGLCDLKASLGPLGDAVQADPHDIWLTSALDVDLRSDLGPEAEVLAGLDVPDPEFENWLRDVRQTPATPPHTGPTDSLPRQANRLVTAPIVVAIVPAVPAQNSDEAFLSLMLMDTLSSRLRAEGDAEIYVSSEPTNQRISEASAYLRLEIASVTRDGQWHVHLRAFVDRGRRFLWSGRLEVPMDFRVIYEGPDISAFVSTALTNIFGALRHYRIAARSSYLALQRTAHRLFTANRDDVARAETELAALSDTTTAAIAFAWRAFALLTRALEFGEDEVALLDQAKGLIQEALRLADDNPLVLALAAQVEIKLCGDLDRGRHLAAASLRACDQNPYALHAMSQAQLFEGAFGSAHETALRARAMAEGLSNAFCWDMQVCLTAVGIEDLRASEAAARAAHACNPDYRPALRYLTALNLIQGQRDRADKFAAALALREPGFQVSRLVEHSYPMHTLRRAGFDRDLVT